MGYRPVARRATGLIVKYRVHDHFEGTIPLYFSDDFESHFRMTTQACHSCSHAHVHITRSFVHVFSHYSPKLVVAAAIRCSNVEERNLSRMSDRKLEDQSHVEFDFRARRNWARAAIVK